MEMYDMKHVQKFTKVLIVMALALTGSWSFAQDTKKTQPDNTAVNERDRKDSELTAQDQTDGSKNDVELTRKIREMLSKDDKLSVYAENIKIVTVNGVA